MNGRVGQVWVGGMSPWVGVFLIVESRNDFHHWYHRAVNLETHEIKTATETTSWDEINAKLDTRGCLDGYPWWRLT